MVDKEKQLQLIIKNNPFNPNKGNHTWIRSLSDVKTYDEVWEEEGEVYSITPDFSKEDAIRALKTRIIRVYSSHPIKNGVFVTPSRMEAENYGGCHSIIANVDDIAWIDPWQGQYANTNLNEEKVNKPMKQIIRLTESELHKIVKESVQRILKEDEWDAYLQQDDDEPTSFTFDDSPSVEETIADKIINDMNANGYDFSTKTKYDIIEDLMINYGCTSKVAELVAEKLKKYF